jgi:hypothetical protein
MSESKKPEEWFTFENLLKVGAGVAAGVAGVKLLQGNAAPKKASANTEAPARRRKKGKRRAAKPASEGAAKTGSASAYTQFVQEKMPGYTARGIKSSEAMSRIAKEWKAEKEG